MIELMSRSPKSKKKIAFVSAMESAPWGGCEELWALGARWLHDQGHSVLACVKKWDPPPRQVTALAASGVEVVVRDHGPRPLSMRILHAVKRRVKGISPADIAGTLSCRRILAFRPDLVCISHGSNTDGLSWMEWCRSEGIPYVSVIQANAEHLWPTDDLAERLLAAHTRALASYFVSKANLHLFENQIAFQLPNSMVVRNPFNVSYQVSPAWPDNDTIYKLACVGRLTPMAKGQDLIFQTLALPVWRDRPISVSLVGDGSTERSLRRLATNLGVEKKVIFRGQIDSIEDIWSNHHALLLPSRYEGLPLALVEAMLCHRMAIVTDVAGHTEVLRDGLHGFVAHAPTVPALADAMEQAWQRRSEWREMGLAAGQHIRALVPESPAAVFASTLTELMPD